MGAAHQADGENEERRMVRRGRCQGRASFDEEFGGTVGIRNIWILWNDLVSHFSAND